MKFGVTYIDPAISTINKQFDVWSFNLLIDECGKGEITILEVYDIKNDKVIPWEN